MSDKQVSVQDYEQLPADPDKLAKWIDLDRERLNARMAQLRALKKLPDAAAAYSATLRETQDVAELHIEAERRLGAVLAAADRRPVKDKETGRIIGYVGKLAGVTKQTSAQAQKIASDPEAVAEYVEDAKAGGKVPTAAGAARAAQPPGSRKRKARTHHTEYWKELGPLLTNVRRVQVAMESSRQVPLGLRKFFKNLEVFGDYLASWDPDKLAECPECQGTGKRKAKSSDTQLDCPNCVNGGVGFYK